jgi:hypothetical protein
MSTTTQQKRTISNKQYQCLVCKNIETHSTNHFGDIYCSCRKCGNSGLSCIEPEAVEAAKQISTIETRLHKYSYDISDPTQQNEYKSLCKELKRKGLKLFDSINSHKWEYWQNLPKTVLVETDYVFDNQWNSTAGRVMDWAEDIYPNKKIKRGYWLELTNEHIEARNPKQYACKVVYMGQVLGEDIISAINTGEASNQLMSKYWKDEMDIWSYQDIITIIK